MTEQVVITGWGGLSSAGYTIDETWNTIKQGKSGIDTITGWDSIGWDYRLGAEIKDFDPKPFMDRKLLKLISRHDTFGLAAVEQAIRHSELVVYRNNLSDPTEFNERTGIYVSSSGSKFYQQYDFFPLFSEAQGDIKKFGTELSNLVHPMWLLRTLPNNVLAYTGIQYGFKGPNQNIVNHSVGGVQAITEAAHELMRGTMERAVVVGYDSVVEPQLQMYFSALGVLSKQGIKPFDKNRDGTILGEGAGALVLETRSAAKKRGATIYAEITPGASTSEAAGIFSIRADGEGLVRVMQETLKRAQLSSNDIGMITAHSNGTDISDKVEADSIHTIFADSPPPVTGFKWSIGHTFAAAGVIETILTLLALKEGIAPGIATLQQKAKDCNTLKVSCVHQPIQKSTALLINRGFGSVSSSLIIKV
jgi:3-oxoacyl-[acyl-carrier-protein] synthase-1